MEAFGIFDVCRELPKDAKVTTYEMGKRSERGLYTSGSTAATGELVDMHAVQHEYRLTENDY